MLHFAETSHIPQEVKVVVNMHMTKPYETTDRLYLNTADHMKTIKKDAYHTLSHRCSLVCVKTMKAWLYEKVKHAWQVVHLPLLIELSLALSYYLIVEILSVQYGTRSLL